MSDVASGVILVAEYQGVYVIKMSGDVRLTLCISFDNCIEELIRREGFYTVMFDLTEAKGLDSTTLGLMAKFAVKGYSKERGKPFILCTDPGILRLLTTMGLDDVCQIIDTPPEEFCQIGDFTEIAPTDNDQSEDKVKAKVLESHCALMALNQQNKETFKDLVTTLQST